MNTKRIYLPVLLCAMLAAVCLSACSTDDAVPSPGDGSSGLRFSVNGVQTRLGYNFEHTTFDDGETIGCVIAEVNGGAETFLCNSKWTYRANDGMLILQEDNGYVAKDQSDESLLTLVDEAKTLKFCFYYPYVDGSLLQDDVKRVYDMETADPSTVFYKELTFPNIATNEGLSFKNQWGGDVTLSESNISDFLNAQILTGTVIDNSANAGNYWNIPGNKYGWTEYPCFVNHTQGDPSAEGQINDLRLQNSDFLWIASPEISSATQHTVNLTFKKKTATILVYCEDRLADIYFTASGEKSLLRGKQINLSSGELTDYTYSTVWDAKPQQKSMYFNAGEHIVPCYRGQNMAENQQYYFYRVVLPAQADCRFEMHIKGDFNRDGAVDTDEKVIRLSDDDGLTELKEGYLYSIRISNDGRTEIRINDWQTDGWFEIEEVTTE